MDTVSSFGMSPFAQASAARRKGRAVCASELNLPAAETEREILDRVECELLNANLFGEVLVNRPVVDRDWLRWAE